MHDKRFIYIFAMSIKTHKTMKKSFKVKAYEAYDYTSECRASADLCDTISEAESRIFFDDAERRESWRQSQWYNHGRANTFEHHEYAVIELIGTADIEVEDDDYEPSFYELCEAVEDWRDGEYCKPYVFED